MSARRARIVRVVASTGSSLLLQARGLVVQLLVWLLLVDPELVLEAVNWVGSLVTLVAIVGKFGLEFTVVQFVAQDRDTDPARALAAFKQASVLRLVLTVVVALPFVLLPDLLSAWAIGRVPLARPELIQAGGLLMLTSSLYEYTSFLLTSTDNFPAMLAARLTYALVNIAGMVGVATVWTGDAAVGVVLAQVAGGLGALIFGTWAAVGEAATLRERAGRPVGWDAALWGELLRFGLPLMLVAAAGQLFAQVDRMMMPFLLPADNHDLGYYGTAQSVASAAMFGTYAVRNIARTRLPGLRRTNPAEAVRSLLATYRASFGIAVWIGAGALAVAPGLIRTVPSEGLGVAAGLVPLFVPWMLLQAVANTSATALVAAGKPRVYALIMGALALLNVVLNAVFIPGLGAAGAVLASTVSMGPLTWLAWRSVRESYEGLGEEADPGAALKVVVRHGAVGAIAGMVGAAVGQGTLATELAAGVVLTVVFWGGLYVQGEIGRMRAAA